MAAAAERKPCAKCQKGAGVTTCDGCQQSFCIKHIIEHRQELAIQMDNIGQQHDILRRDLIEEDSTHPLLSYIDEWEQSSIEKIQRAAKTTRADLRKLLNQMKNNVKSSVNKIADELQERRELDDFTEIDLTRWYEKLTDIRKLLETPATIKIEEDDNPSINIRLIKVIEEKQLNFSSDSRGVEGKSLSISQTLPKLTQEMFDKTTERISLSESGLVATYTGKYDYSYHTIFGKNLYHSGLHHILFRVENKDSDNFFFGIVTSSQDIVKNIFSVSSANGWWGFDVPVVNGENQNSSDEKILQIGDVVKLTLDCDMKRIQFENNRANMTLQSLIDIRECPFPWKIAISLSLPNDILRIVY